MPEFPFAHLIFNSKDTDYIVNFLDKLGKGIGHKFSTGFVPHSIVKGTDKDILIIPNKIHKEKCIGSSDVSGHYFGCKS